MQGFLEILGIAGGVILAGWGLFHQLIVGGAVTMVRVPDEKEARLFVMSWVAQGAFMTFAGILPGTMIFLHGIFSGPAHTVFAITGTGLFFLSGHVFLSGYKTHIRPVQIGAVLEVLYAVILFLLVVFT